MNDPAGTLVRLLCTFAVVVASPLMAAPTGLDPNFASGGVLLLPENYRPSYWQSTPDGQLFAMTEYKGSPPGLVHFDSGGHADPSFAGTGVLVPRCAPACKLDSFALTADGRIVTLHDNGGYPGIQTFLGRFTAQGSPDLAIGPDGTRYLYESARGGAAGVVGAPSGEMFAMFGSSSIQTATVGLLRITAGGGIGKFFGQVDTLGGVPFAYIYKRLLVQPDGGLLAATPGLERGLAISRFRNDAADLSFGVGGRAIFSTPGLGASFDVALSPDGIVVAGTAEVDGVAQIAIARADDHGTFDMRFGSAGLAIVNVAREREAVTDVKAYVQPSDGAIVVAATVQGELAPNRPSYRIALARLHPDGTLDDQFAPGGVAEFWQQWGTWLTFLAPGPEGTILAGGEVVIGWRDYWTPLASSVIFRLQGGALPAARPTRERQAIEYFHQEFGHYFVTAEPAQIATLDMAWSPQWARTGKSFGVFDKSGGNDVCRFWSDQSFAPTSTHFYTPYPDECATLHNDPRWKFEGIAFQLALPVGQLGSRACPDPMQSLYRAFNDMKGGAPNHRYMADIQTLDEMVAQGWIMEGEAETRVFACTPPHN